MITVVTQTTEERKLKMESKYQDYLDLYHNSTLTVKEITAKLGIHHRSEVMKYIREKNRENNLNPVKRAKLIQYGKWLKDD